MSAPSTDPGGSSSEREARTLTTRALEWLKAGWRGVGLPLRPILPVLILGLAIRLILVPISLNIDLANFAETSATMVYGQGPYSHPSVYAPFWLLYLNAVGRVTALVTPAPLWLTTSGPLQSLYVASGTLAPPYQVSLSFVVVEKGSLILFDLATGLLIYHLAYRLTRRPATATLAFAVWFLNPLVILMSSVQGTYDVIPTFLVLVALLLAFAGRPCLSGAAVATGTLVGVFPFLFAPLAAAAAWKQPAQTTHERMGSLAWFAGGIAVPVVTVLAAPGLFLAFAASAVVGPSRGTGTYGGFGFWGLFSIPGLHGADTAFSSLPGTAVTVAAAGSAIALSVVLSLWLVLRRSSSPNLERSWVGAAALIAVFALLIPQVDQPQYVVWSLPFLLLLALEARPLQVLYGILSALPAAFYFVLGGPLLMFLPLWYQYHVVPYSAFATSFPYWIQAQSLTFPAEFAPFAVGLVAVVVLIVRELFPRLFRRSPERRSGP